jgi:hypothetical protein
MPFKLLNNIAGWIVFAISAAALCLAAEPTGSLWDCGEFISGAYKLQVVHPPGAPIFLLVGRMFTWVASLVSSNPETIAFSVNVLSALCTAFAATFICWSTTILGRLALVGRDGETSQGQSVAIIGAGIVAGLTTAFCSSIWFSAVEGEVYAMSTFFTCLTLWATLKWYYLPNNADADRWLVFAMFGTALSIGVHLLSLLTFPALAMFYYFKRAKSITVTGALSAAVVGVLFIVGIQYFIIAGIPRFWAYFDKLFVNSFGLPFYSGIVAVFAVFGAAIYYALRYARQTGNGLLQRLIVAVGLIIIAYFSYGTVIIRAKANTPINMNDPSDPMRLLPYLNREQYGERPLLYGPDFDAKPVDVVSEPRYGRVGDEYEIVDEKVDYEYAPGSKSFFPRMGDYSQGRPKLYRDWIDKKSGAITVADNFEFFWKYQIQWMWWRYFMWNFSGRQNGEQGYYAWDPSAGHWITGFDGIDEAKIGKVSELPEYQKSINQANNKYYMIPFLLGLLGMFFHYKQNNRDFAAIMALFIITGIGIIVYSNQPPNEPRERDYVLVGSFFTYAIWVGMSVLFLYQLLAKYIGGVVPSLVGTAVGLVAPFLMVTQNWDDHARSNHYGSRDYAKNFLESCAPNAIIFTYGDNDTYPLWYCQEVENIRTDVRVVNLSLIAVDWYINQLRRKVNNSEPIKMSIPAEQIRGFKRVQIPYGISDPARAREMNLRDVIKYLGEDHRVPTGGGGRDFDTSLPTHLISIPVDKAAVYKAGLASPNDTSRVMVDSIHMDLGAKTTYIIKDQLAIMDIISSNIWDRPIYWAVTCREDRLMGLEDYLQLEGLGLRLVPFKGRTQPEYGIIGSGSVDTDKAYDNIMNKWSWGNFDKEHLFVTKSYLPSLQTMKLTMIRVGRNLTMEQKKDKAIALSDKFFEVFPTLNFAHDQFSTYMADSYARNGANDKAAAKIREIASQMEQQLRYIEVQEPAFKAAYRQDQQFILSSVQTMMGSAAFMKDDALMSELEAQFGPYMPKMPSGEELRR